MVQNLETEIVGFDPVAAVERLGGATRFLFQRFDPATRRLSRTVAGLDVAIVGAGEDFAAALREGMAQMDAGAPGPCLVFAGFEALTGRSERVDGWPGHLMLRVTRGFDVDHAGGAVRLIGIDRAELAEVSIGRQVGASAQADATGAEAPSPKPWTADVDRAGHARNVDAIRQAIAAGAVEGVVLSIGLSRPTTAAPFALYRAFVAANPSPYGFVLTHAGAALIGSSPLAFLGAKGRHLHLETDAGTRPVTGDAARDDAAASDLMVNAKDAAEHHVVVEAEREALAGIACGGTVGLAVDREVRRFSHVMHLYSALEAELADGLDLADAILALAPAAAASGRPKRAAAALGRDLEGAPRGPYGGVIGLIEPGRADLAVVIRSLWLAEGQARLRVGGKVVAGSSAEAEYREAMAKARFLVDGVARAEQGATG